MDSNPGPVNAILGDNIDLPTTQIPIEQLNEEKLLARFSKTKEFKRLKDHLESRIEFFQKNFPDGTTVSQETDHQKLVDYWRAANIVIGEFRYILSVYENANEVVADDARRIRQL